MAVEYGIYAKDARKTGDLARGRAQTCQEEGGASLKYTSATDTVRQMHRMPSCHSLCRGLAQLASAHAWGA